MTLLRVASNQCTAGRPIPRRTYALPVMIRVIPENEIPRALHVDIYYMDFAIPCTQRFWLCPVDFRKLHFHDIGHLPSYAPLPLARKRQINSEDVKMEMLVTKFSNGKYRNEGELFDEPISNENVKLMGEMVALQTLRTLKKYDWKIADKYYIGLIKSLQLLGCIFLLGGFLLYIKYSMWSGYRKKDDVKRLIRVFEQRNCPTYTLHTSGHADSNAIAQLINTVAPKEIVYVHGET